MHHFTCLLTLSLSMSITLASHAVEQSRLIVVGDLDAFIVGQDGYCGARTNVPSSDWKKILVRSDERVWFEAKSLVRSTSFNTSCSGDYSFVPEAGQAYIIRYWLDAKQCHFELFRVVPRADPVPQALTISESQSCLFK